jgi:hypothetical protein
VPGFKGVS